MLAIEPSPWPVPALPTGAEARATVAALGVTRAGRGCAATGARGATRAITGAGLDGASGGVSGITETAGTSAGGRIPSIACPDGVPVAMTAKAVMAPSPIVTDFIIAGHPNDDVPWPTVIVTPRGKPEFPPTPSHDREEADDTRRAAAQIEGRLSVPLATHGTPVWRPAATATVTRWAGAARSDELPG